mgnify:CR=1 FL=1
MSRSAEKVRRARSDLIWIGVSLLVIHCAALAQFTKGFLLTRPVRNEISTSRTPDPPFDRAVLLIVDALKYDFLDTEEFPVSEISPYGKHAFKSMFWADPPTTTLQRLKGLTTGSLPAFIDAGSNFGGSLIDEDNWVAQACASGSVAFVGDDTWTSLFNNFSVSYPYPSLNVRDLHTVDNGVKEIMPQLIANKSNTVVIGHMLGVDHVGHRYGPDHPEMTLKLRSTFEFVKQIAEQIDDDTVLIVMGDHGMDPTGNHGGDSEDELKAGLFVYSKQPKFSYHSSENSQSSQSSESSESSEGSESSESSKSSEILSYRQTDFVPTISAWLGQPIPFSSLGIPISEGFSDEYDFNALDSVFKEQLQTYAKVAGVDVPTGDISTAVMHAKILDELMSVWVLFDVRAMIKGCVLMFMALVYSIRLSPAPQRANRCARLVPYGFLFGLLAGLFFGAGHGWRYWADVLFYTGCGNLLSLLGLPRRSIFSSKWSYFAMLVLFIESTVLFSNSFVIWEPRVLHYCAATIIIILLLACLHTSSALVSNVGLRLAISVLFILRVLSSITVCREETSSMCETTFYLPNSSMFPLYYLFILAGVSLVFLPLIKPFFAVSENFVGVASMIVEFTVFALLLGITFWSLEAADTRGLLNGLLGSQTARIFLARSLLSLGVAFGLFIWWKSPLLFQLVLDKTGKIKRLAGIMNIYGSYAILPIFCILWSLIPVNKPPGIISLVGMVYAILAILDLTDLGGAKDSLLPPVLFEMLAYITFFATGHQATIPSIQWDIAFSASKTAFSFWSVLAVTLNQIGPFLICAFPTTLYRLWRRSPFKEPIKAEMLLGTAMAHTTFVSGTRTLASMLAALLFRRHLMAWKIFAPRFMLGAIALVTTDVACILAVLLCSNIVQKVTAFFNKND